MIINQQKSIKFILLGALALFAGACSTSNQVATDYDVKADFSQYTTYNFWEFDKEDEKELGYDQLDERRVKEALVQQMESRGYTMTEKPDLLVNVRIMVKTRQNATTNNMYPYRYYWGGGYNININEYEESTIVVDLVDAQKKELVWQGSIEMPTTTEVEARDRKIKDAVMTLFLKYPHRAGKMNATSSLR
ncbi:DUF4136 domain-containing protein [Flexithrix dorotheae]|uniref:DUF4136 domain-containing protein n=1 Tax=Flexithrix dorotheae TaxID=70993 RepID=UPI00037F6C2B|nr:DUF4136 domain-containing protein [Flexithrix dorotheae]